MIQKIIFACSLAFSTPLFAKGGGGGAPLNFMKLGPTRISTFYSSAGITDIKTSNISGLKSATFGGFEYDFGYPAAVDLGVLYLQHRGDSTATWQGAANTPVEFYAWVLHLGLKFFFPTKYLIPWFSLGLAGGEVTLSNPNDRTTNDFRVAFADRGVRTMNLTGHLAIGLDVVFGDGKQGLRFSHAYIPFTTPNATEIGASYDMTFRVNSIGVVFLTQ